MHGAQGIGGQAEAEAVTSGAPAPGALSIIMPLLGVFILGLMLQSPAQDSLPGVTRLRLGQARGATLRANATPIFRPPTLECPMPVVVPVIPELGRMPVLQYGAARQPAFLRWSTPCTNPLFDAARLPERRRPRE